MYIWNNAQPIPTKHTTCYFSTTFKSTRIFGMLIRYVLYKICMWESMALVIPYDSYRPLSTFLQCRLRTLRCFLYKPFLIRSSCKNTRRCRQGLTCRLYPHASLPLIRFVQHFYQLALYSLSDSLSTSLYILSSTGN